ncbi:NadS family protein [Moraxella bovis]|uniref:Putative transcriptional regulator n=1 Tax=Moraxella bovis TaxID=476 RepID=A0A378PT40_MORBO|nr:NadS family protein [Moraxella bovis]STY91471.1 putative transcriptional regulator [Moraxella bovis]
MDKQLFNDIVASMNEAIAITKGEQAPSRVFTYERPDIKEVRAKTGLSQIQFAKKLNISPKTLQNWEQGTRTPTGPAITLIRLLDKNPDLLNMA